MNRIKQRPPGALWLHEFEHLKENAGDEDIIYHCSAAARDRGPTKMALKKCWVKGDWVHVPVRGWGRLSVIGVHLIDGNDWCDAYLFDNFWLAYAYKILVDKILNDQ